MNYEFVQLCIFVAVYRLTFNGARIIAIEGKTWRERKKNNAMNLNIKSFK